MEDLRYPVGKFHTDKDVTPEKITAWIKEIEETPARLREAVAGLTDEQLDTVYRPEGWTVRQVVHHLPDSHVNSYVRFKLALTEDNPTIRPYLEKRWAEQPEAKSAPIDVSLDLLEALHKRWVMVLRNMSADDYKRTFFHPEDQKSFDMNTNIQLYVWHCNHHLAHITRLRERMGW